jgi:hypothetical protein
MHMFHDIVHCLCFGSQKIMLSKFSALFLSFVFLVSSWVFYFPFTICVPVSCWFPLLSCSFLDFVEPGSIMVESCHFCCSCEKTMIYHIDLDLLLGLTKSDEFCGKCIKAAVPECLLGTWYFNIMFCSEHYEYLESIGAI